MISREVDEKFDMVVVGTGWFGLAAARVYIALHPEERILVIEAADTCGGTWGEQRIYPGLRSNNLVGRYEYPDFPMAANEARYGVKKGEHIPGAVLLQYLTDFAKGYGVFERTIVDLMGWNEHTETAKLKPWNAPFWTGSALSIHNWDNNFNELVKSGKIRVHIADVDHLSPRKVHLTTGDILDADVIICSTGWKKEPSVKFLDFAKESIGLPQSRKEQAILKEKADNDILTTFPRLKDQPKFHGAPKDTEPYRLYRFIVPPSFVKNHNFAIAGAISSVSTSIGATVQGLWISAFLDGKLDRLATSNDEIAKEVMLHTQWGKWRYPCGYGASLPDIVFDCVPYNDLLLRDLGMEVHRKKGFWRDTFTWYGPEEYRGLIEEWIERKGGDGYVVGFSIYLKCDVVGGRCGACICLFRSCHYMHLV